MSDHKHKWKDEDTRTIQGFWYVWQRCQDPECNELRVVTDAPRRQSEKSTKVNDYGYGY